MPVAAPAVIQTLITRGCIGGGGVVDTDGDGLSDTFEGTLGTDPNLADTDGDGLDDGAENDIHFTNALEADSDGDGTNDGDEIANRD